MKKRIVKNAFKLAKDIFNDVNKNKYSKFCNYNGICVKDNCKNCKYNKKKEV